MRTFTPWSMLIKANIFLSNAISEYIDWCISGSGSDISFDDQESFVSACSELQQTTADDAPEMAMSFDMDAISTTIQKNTSHAQKKMVDRFNSKKGSNVEVFSIGEIVSLFLPRRSRGSSTDGKRVFCRIIRVAHGSKYQLQCCDGIIDRFYSTRELERIPLALANQIALPPSKHLPKRRITLATTSKLAAQRDQTRNLMVYILLPIFEFLLTSFLLGHYFLHL